MFTIQLITGDNPYAAAHYFGAADDYYSKEHAGEWYGQGAAALGLEGDVEQAEFARLLNGHLPNGEQIAATIGHDNKKRMGFDLGFAAPKSVSMQALVGGDGEILAAHDRAVHKALEQLEPLTAARYKIQGKSYREQTGNLLAGVFRHEMSRAKDPHLHTHAVALNVTQRQDGAWRAIANEQWFPVQHQIGALYKMELARELQTLGYDLRITSDHGDFELAHISRDQIEAFSQRSQVIEQALADVGKTRHDTTPLERQIIALATRPRKDERDRELIKRYWAEKSTALGIDYHPSPASTGMAMNTSPSTANFSPARVAVAYAVKHLSEREQVFGESQLHTVALHRAVGMSTPDDIKNEITRLAQQGTLIPTPPTYKLSSDHKSTPLTIAGWRQWLADEKQWSPNQSKRYVDNAIRLGSLIVTEQRYTTQTALKREQAILAIERAGRHQVIPIQPQQAIQQQLQNSTLTPGQRQAIELIVGSPHRFAGVQGDAGTGKTHALRQAVQLTESAGWRTIAVAPYGNQVKALKEHGLDAHTLASFLNTKRETLTPQTLVILDEAGVVPARQMQQLLQQIERHGARLVMIGDTKQTEAIEAGKPFWQLQQAGMATARITEIQRQRDPELKHAVGYAAMGNVSASLNKLKHIEPIADDPARRSAIVNDYMALPANDRQQTLIIAGTHEARLMLNDGVRQALGLQGHGKTYPTLARLDTTQAQRRYAPAFKPGSIIQPEKDYPRAGLIRGELYTVKEALPGNRLRIARADNSELDINPRHIRQLSVYQVSPTELSIGDQVRVNRNDAALDLTNGDRFKVVALSTKTVTLHSEQTPPRRIELLADKPLHLEHAYATTIHSAQGLTSDRVLIEMDTRSRTTSHNLYYVAISRARHEARLYTDSAPRLPEAIARRYDKTTALSVQRARQMQPQGMTRPALEKGLKEKQLDSGAPGQR